MNTSGSMLRYPAPAYVAQHGDLLKQLGATKVEATDPYVITATYTDNATAMNAGALLKDTAWGAKLVVDNRSGSREMVRPTVEGVANVLRAVKGLDVKTVYPADAPDGRGVVFYKAADQQLQADVTELIRSHPAPDIAVWVDSVTS